MNLKQLFLSFGAIGGWIIVTYIVIIMFIGGGSATFSINMFGEMYIEVITTPILLIIIIIIFFMELKNG